MRSPMDKVLWQLNYSMIDQERSSRALDESLCQLYDNIDSLREEMGDLQAAVESLRLGVVKLTEALERRASDA